MYFLESITQLSYFYCCVRYRKPIVRETLHIFLHSCFSVQRELKIIKTFSLISPLERILGKSDQKKTCIIDFFYILTCEETYSISPFKERIPDSHYPVVGKGGSCIFLLLFSCSHTSRVICQWKPCEKAHNKGMKKLANFQHYQKSVCLNDANRLNSKCKWRKKMLIQKNEVT